MANIKVDDPRVFPSLTDGWIGGNLGKIDNLLSCWLVSDYSQSQVFHGSIMSLPKMVAEYGHDPEVFVNSVQQKMIKWLSRSFDGVDVDLTYKYIEEFAEGGPYGVFFTFTAMANGTRINLTGDIEIADSKLTKLMQISNGEA